MCGFAGSVSARGGAVDLSRAMAVQAHRGPDDRGVWTDGTCTLGHVRLAVLDTGAAACQPMVAPASPTCLAYNGEVYNFRALRHDLARRGHRFLGTGDTEVVLAAYEEWGEDLVLHLRGMFAFAIWDPRRKSLLLARDRIGKKPLFVARSAGTIAFSSELQGLLAIPGTRRSVDLRAIDEFLTWGYVPAPRTGFDGIEKLPPAHCLRADVVDGDIAVRTWRYWDLPYEPKLELSEQDAVSAVRDTVVKAVEDRLVSDRPVGALLSGGVDSSIVVGVMAAATGSRVPTFSVGFSESAYDELPHARLVADRFGTDHHEEVVEPDVLELLPQLVRHYGEPYADSSALAAFHIARVAADDVTVVLTGDGGDESFAGYDRYRASRMAADIGKVPGSREALRLAARLLPSTGHPKSRVQRAARFAAAASEPASRRYARWMTTFDEEVKSCLYAEELQRVRIPAGEGLVDRLGAASEGRHPVDAAMAVDLESYLPYDLLVKTDIASMAHGLEARSPLLDQAVMELAARLPVRTKLRGSSSKWILKKAFEDLLPRQVASRPKMGFAVPVGAWFRGPMTGFLDDTLLSPASVTAPLFRDGAVQRLRDEHVSATADHGARLWSLVMLELWHRELVGAPAGMPR